MKDSLSPVVATFGSPLQSSGPDMAAKLKSIASSEGRICEMTGIIAPYASKHDADGLLRCLQDCRAAFSRLQQAVQDNAKRSDCAAQGGALADHLACVADQLRLIIRAIDSLTARLDFRRSPWTTIGILGAGVAMTGTVAAVIVLLKPALLLTAALGAVAIVGMVALGCFEASTRHRDQLILGHAITAARHATAAARQEALQLLGDAAMQAAQLKTTVIRALNNAMADQLRRAPAQIRKQFLRDLVPALAMTQCPYLINGQSPFAYLEEDRAEAKTDQARQRGAASAEEKVRDYATRGESVDQDALDVFHTLFSQSIENACLEAMIFALEQLFGAPAGSIGFVLGDRSVSVDITTDRQSRPVGATVDFSAAIKFAGIAGMDPDRNETRLSLTFGVKMHILGRQIQVTDARFDLAEVVAELMSSGGLVAKLADPDSAFDLKARVEGVLGPAGR